MKYYYKVCLWENGQKSTDYTNYLTVPIFLEDRLNDQLSSGEIILDLMPLSTRNDFPPKTKILIERYKKKDYTDKPKVWQMIVEHDDVEEYTGVPDTCCHRITLIELSAIAQGMHVDNIALTYELQDVDLNYKTYNPTGQEPTQAECKIGGADDPIRLTSYENTRVILHEQFGLDFETGIKRNGIFKNSYRYIWDENSLNDIQKLKLYVSATESQTISFQIPKLYCYGSTNNLEFDKQLFQVNTITNIYKYETNGYNPLPETKSLVLSVESGPTNIAEADNEWYFSDGDEASLRAILLNPESLPYGDILGGAVFEDVYTTDAIMAKVGKYPDLITFQTDTLSDSELEQNKCFYYTIECYANPVNYNSMLSYYECSFETLNVPLNLSYNYRKFTSSNREVCDFNQVYVKNSFYAIDTRQEVEIGPMISKGAPYNAYELLRKALLTIDTQIIDNEQTGIDNINYFLYVKSTEPDWLSKLKSTTIQETIFEGKNLWEVLIQLGYYLHAVPYLEFANDGTDRFMLSFKQLGGNTAKDNTNTKITIFNSKNLNDYFTQFDSYVTNLFSPQNLVEEWLVPTTSDNSYLISNDTAELKTTYGITEVVEFDITYDGSAGGTAGTVSALKYIFEHSIYQILTSDFNISPGKGDSLYYELGGNQILGLNYVPPSPNNDRPMALKSIVGRLFNANTANIKFNDLKFRIKYRTQDSARISQVRPDIQNFMKNSSYEKYPKHSQFYGQQDKIVDSERFSLNLYGQLIRVGNNIYQCQEAVEIDSDEKECGDLVQINGENYYVTEIENEMYPDITLQKVTYSKDFNQLSQIVTIPSEPRFYEVSERSKIRREVMLFDFFSISTQPNETVFPPRFLNNWKSVIKNILFRENEQILPNYAWTRFRADKQRDHKGALGQQLQIDEVFPSSELDRTDPNKVKPKASSDHSDNIVPLLHYPLKDGIVFEWDMEDNFKAGDCIDTELSGGNSVDEAYYALQAVRYCDVMGRADLFNFRLFNKTDWTHEQAQDLPKACIEPAESDCFAYQDITKAIALDKDCREELSFNYQINLLHRNENNSGDFVTFSNLFGEKDGRLICCALKDNVSVFDSNMNTTSANILADNLTYTLTDDEDNNQIKIHITKPVDLDITEVKAIVFYDLTEDDRVSYLAKNFKNQLIDEFPDFYIYPVYNDN